MTTGRVDEIGDEEMLGAGLYSVGIPKNSLIEYEIQIKAGTCVVLVHGTLEM